MYRVQQRQNGENLTAYIGPVAPYFGQDGYATQFYNATYTVGQLQEMGFLQEILVDPRDYMVNFYTACCDARFLRGPCTP